MGLGSFRVKVALFCFPLRFPFPFDTAIKIAVCAVLLDLGGG